MRFVSHHTHTTYSYGDGYGTPEQHADRLVELGYRGSSLTEHGNVSSHVKHEQACDKLGLKPGYGCELYTAPEKEKRKWHQTILALDLKGYRNLNQLVSRTWSEGFYQWPTANAEMLAEYAEGMAITSGCADSLLACTLLGGKSYGEKRDIASPDDIRKAEKVARWYKSIYGDRYYLEVQQFPELPRICTLNAIYAELSEKLNIPLLATADVHYPYPTDSEMQTVLHSAMRGSTVDQAEASWEYSIKLTYPTSDKELGERLMRTGLSRKQAWAAIVNSSELLDRMSVKLPKNEPLRYPLEDAPSDEWSPGMTPKDAHELIWQWLRRGWQYRWAENSNMRANKKAYKERLDYEMSIIEPKDFNDYFLVLSDLVRFAKGTQIAVGPARGSAAASLVCYLLRITEVDPIQFPMMVFERFIDKTREDMPDVDLDFADDRRDEVRLRAIERYGNDYVANIGNFVRYKGKNSINDVARVYRIPKWAAEGINDLVIERSGGDSRFDSSLADTFELFPAAKKIYEQYPQFEKATRLEGNTRGMSVHAAGLVISSKPISDTCATYTRTSAGRTLSALAYDKKDAEYLGMLKADILGLSTMGMINIALREIGMTIEELYRIPLDDDKTIDPFTRGDVMGVFQFEGRATRLVCKDVKPTSFLELADINALSRPGPLFSGATSQYVSVKHGRAEPMRLHPVVDEITAWTKGQIVYQEQILRIVREIGNFPWTHAAAIRKIITQKKGEAAFHANFQNFADGAKEVHGIELPLAEKIWKFMITSASYAFPISHSVSYAMIAYWCQWIRVHHPLAFYTAQLSKNDKEKWPRLLRDARSRGLDVLPPDVNISGATWTAVRKEGRPFFNRDVILAGFEQVEGIAARKAEAIIDYREQIDKDKLPLDWYDLQNIRGFGEKTIAKIVDFVEQDDPFNIDLVQRQLTGIRRGEMEGLPLITHNGDQIYDMDVGRQATTVVIAKQKDYKDWVEDQHSRTGEDFEKIRATMKDPHLVKSCVLRCYDDSNEEVYLRLNRWDFPKFQAAIERIELDKDILVVTGKKKSDFGASIHIARLIVISPE